MTPLTPGGPAAAPEPVGATIGVEQELHVVDAHTYAALDDDALSSAVLHGEAGRHVHAEIATTQVEAATGVCRTLEELRSSLAAARAEAAAAAATVGGAVLAASTHPFAGWADQRLTSGPRYLTLYERWGVLALQQVICSCHVHVAVPDLDTAVTVMDHVRPYLPLVLALTGSSPFHEGTDTGYDSYRTQWFDRWPITGPPEPLGDAGSYLGLVYGLKAAGVIDDASNLYWDVRPSSRYPTLEFRVADVATDLDDSLLHAALVRSLTRVLDARDRTGRPAPEVRPELLRAARWRAARYGIQGQLFDPVRLELVDAPVAVRRLLEELRDDLTEHGEWDEVSALTEQLLARGTSAQRQRAVLHRTGDLRSVAEMLVRESQPPPGPPSTPPCA
ncbi:glutamate--cysteine ligase [Quadrisphaera sp. DSM 44207]|uniref:carboxylate-amine ligase n=1 Tax=Quadrisphaera sp. DSM 44207 TaxID=1881057 RepID=UPI00088C20DC|nr:glutamate--cysteine ligase [Quadrisphaera sp. DSM 44207]SDQ04013.1 carboxylate-amine ligase [Quadrisphaera sp. DSM 44207]